MSFDTLADAEQIRKTADALKSRGIAAEVLQDGREALARLRELIPAGASVSTGASLTLKEIGFEDLLISGAHPWKNLKAEFLGRRIPPVSSSCAARACSPTVTSEASTPCRKPARWSSPA